MKIIAHFGEVISFQAECYAEELQLEQLFKSMKEQDMDCHVWDDMDGNTGVSLRISPEKP